jgi:hypothetical protein
MTCAIFVIRLTFRASVRAVRAVNGDLDEAVARNQRSELRQPVAGSRAVFCRDGNQRRYDARETSSGRAITRIASGADLSNRARATLRSNYDS